VVATERGGASVTDVDVAGGGARGEGGVEGEEKEEEGCGCSAVHVHVHGTLLCVGYPLLVAVGCRVGLFVVFGGLLWSNRCKFSAMHKCALLDEEN